MCKLNKLVLPDGESGKNRTEKKKNREKRGEQNNITRAVEVSYYPVLVTKEISLKVFIATGQENCYQWSYHLAPALANILTQHTGNKERIKWNDVHSSSPKE